MRIDLDVLPTKFEVRMIKAGSEVRLLLLDGSKEVFRSRTEYVALCKEGLPYDVYVG